VQIEGLAIRLRPRTPIEAADLGVRLCQSTARSLYPCFAVVAVPVLTLALASSEIAGWLPSVVIWCAKPWLDRTVLFILSRAAFGEATTVSDLWRNQRQVWWSQLLFTLTVRRLSLWRSLTQPVYQLEGFSVWKAGARVRQIRRRNIGSALMMTSVFNVSETAISLSLLSLVYWFAPAGHSPDLTAVLDGETSSLLLSLTLPGAYAIAVFFLEPFFVAAGFAMYLNRRADLEAWDIEQEFRRAFAQ
jgi:hypothetical protein